MKRKILCAMILSMSILSSACSSGASMSSSTAASSAPYYSEAASSAEAAGIPEASASVGDTDRQDGTWEDSETNSGESYLVIDENKEILTEQNTMLTFSLKVDTASYNNVQRYLENGELPPKDAVRTEELINYFHYEEPVPPATRRQPFSLYTETAPSPFDSNKQIAFVRVKTPEIDKEELPPSNITFLIDTSGSMNSYDKLPLLKQAFSMLVETLDEEDRVSIVTYAGSAGVVLNSASGSEKRKILSAFDRLEAGGSTAGANGIKTAYQLAEKNYMEDGNNRVILATDGDFNVGPSSNEALSKLVKQKKESGVYLSIIGFGTGNIRDDLMETLSKDGNGNYAYINSLRTAEKVLVEELSATLFTVADDVKAQIEFNPQNVASYRLVGYENRALRNEDFENDAKDAGEIGVGTDVVAMFELTLKGAASGDSGLKYQQENAETKTEPASGDFTDELYEVRIRYKDPGESESKLATKAITQEEMRSSGSSDLQFACAIAQFGLLLRQSEYAQTDSVTDIYVVAEENLGRDSGGYRVEFLKMLEQYQALAE